MKILKRFSSTSNRTHTIVRHIGLSSIYKVGSILIAFFLVPLSITYLGSEKYGLWLTIFSFVGWFNFFDFGIGHGLRNKLTEARAAKDMKLAKAYVSTAYFSMFFIALFLIALFLTLFSFIPWEVIFNYQEGDESLSQLILIVYVIFSINLILKMINVIYFADQRPSSPGLVQLIGQLIVFTSIYVATKLTGGSLLLYGSVVVGAQMLVLLLATIVAFSGKYSNIRPNIAAFEKKYVYDILTLGGKFFLIQITGVVLYSTDNFIINYYLGASEVTVYNIAHKYFMLVTMGISIILTPYWSAFTDAHAKDDILWIRRSIANLLKFSVFASIVVIFMIFVADKAYFLWVGEAVQVPMLLTVLMGIHAIVQVFVRPLVMYINGIGKIKIQLYFSLAGAAINIPLSILLAVYFGLGVSGVILATLISTIYMIFIYPIQVYRLINGTAKGIWNE